MENLENLKEEVQEEKEFECPEDAYVCLHDINKVYDNGFHAVHNFNIDIKKHEFIVFVGPSGCGKSTSLRMIAGLEDISSGDLFIDGEKVNDLSPKDRDIAMVFQSYALYPHMTVFNNMEYSLKIRKFPHVQEDGTVVMKKLSRKEIHERVVEAAKILQIEDLLDRKPKALSGGQRQRVALGRAIVRNAKVFLMDEPLSNLDAKLRVQMRAEIVRLHNQLKATTIYVTHDQTEAMTMASRIVIMKKGFVQQIGTPEEIFNNPANMFVAGFIGSPAMNFLKVTYKDEVITFENGIKMPFPKKYHNGRNLKENMILGVRPEYISDIESHLVKDYLDSAIEVNIELTELLGSEYFLHADFNGIKLISKQGASRQIKVGDKKKVCFNLDKLHFFDPETEETIS